MIRSNLHCHTAFCDGENTAREMVEAALKLGFCSVGVSEHAPQDEDPDYGMRPDAVADYVREVNALKSEYRGRIDVFLGIELDSSMRMSTADFDYVIGSCHYTVGESGPVILDDTPELLMDGIKTGFGGDAAKMIRAYYEQFSAFALQNDFQIAGHLDLPAKFNDVKNMFDQSSTKYRCAAYDCIDVMLKRGKIIEVNTGAISRGYKREPYPSCELLRRIYGKKGSVIVTSDAHSAKNTAFWFDEAAELLRSIGFKTQMMLTKDGFAETEL